MCELMGMSFNKMVSANFSFKGFVHRGNQNKDGWGLAFYPDGSSAAQVIAYGTVKRPILRSETAAMRSLAADHFFE